MRKKETLVLVNQEKNLYFPKEYDKCELMSIYKYRAYWHRFLRKIILKGNFPGKGILFSHWKSKLKYANKVIIFDTGNIVEIVQWIKQKYPEKRVIVWYWNSVDSTIHPNKFVNDDIEFWSFDIKDCQKYGFSFNTQFYISGNLKRAITDNKNYTDAFFVGSDKNREMILKGLADIFDKEKIEYYFHIVKYGKSLSTEFNYKKPLKYPDVLGYIKNCKVIIDLVADWQNGLTLRPLEALFHKKKLITNMKNIIDYDIYNPNNIFILGVDDNKKLFDFVHTEYDVKNHDKLIAKYDFDNWLDRFY